jgi:hypothetical protein
MHGAETRDGARIVNGTGEIFRVPYAKKGISNAWCSTLLGLSITFIKTDSG